MNSYLPLRTHLEKNGQSFSMDNLKKLAQEQGFSAYTGTDKENADLVTKLGATAPNISSSTAKIVSGNIMQSTTSQTRKDTEATKRIDGMAAPSNTAGQGNPQGVPVYSYENGNSAGKATIVGYRQPDGTITPVGGVAAGGGQTPTDPNKPGTTTATPTAIGKTPDGLGDVYEQPQAGSYAYKAASTLQDGEKYGYGKEGRRYIMGKDGKVKNDQFADQEYEANKTSIQKEKERTELYDGLKKNLDSAHANLLDSIKKTFEVRKNKQEEINKRYMALKQTQGFSSGMSEYMAEIQTGVLQDEEEQGNARLAELDAKEQELIAQAVQAKSDDDLELASKRLAEIDKVQKDKQDTIQTIYKAAVDYNKQLDDREKEIRQVEKDNFAKAKDNLKTSAAALVKAYDSLPDDKKKVEFLEAMAKRLGVDVSMVLGTIEERRQEEYNDNVLNSSRDRANRGKKTGTDEEDDFGSEEDMSPEEVERVGNEQDFFGKVDQMIAQKFRMPGTGVPVATEKGYITYAAFKDLWSSAQSKNISRDAFLTRLGGKLNLSTFSKAKSGYGLTDAEYTKLKK